MTWPLLTGFAAKWRCWLKPVPSVGAPDGYLLVDYDDSWGEQNLDAQPQLINPTQNQAWLIRLFAFLPQMARVLGEPVPSWWREVYDHLPPITTGAPDSIGGGLYWEHATNALSPDDSLYALFPAETANTLGAYGAYAGGSNGSIVPAGGESSEFDRGQLLAANTTLVRTTITAAQNPLNRTYFWSPTPFVVCRGCDAWVQAARVAAARPSFGMSSCVLHSWGSKPYGDMVECLNEWLELSMRNGTFRTIPFFAQGMLENIAVTQAVNDMLLSSHGFGLKLFPIWAAIRPTEAACFVPAHDIVAHQEMADEHMEDAD